MMLYILRSFKILNDIIDVIIFKLLQIFEIIDSFPVLKQPIAQFSTIPQ